jgi:hypothetical protein
MMIWMWQELYIRSIVDNSHDVYLQSINKVVRTANGFLQPLPSVYFNTNHIGGC